MLFKSNFLVGVAVANQSGAMEADTISKNGRSLKSQTIRGNSFRKVVLNYSVIAVLVISTTIMSCNQMSYDENMNDDDKVQLLEMHTISDNVVSGCAVNSVKYIKYEYDYQNRFTKILSYDMYQKLISTETFTYRENDLVKVVYEEVDNPQNVKTTEYARSGKKISITQKSSQSTVTDTYTINLNNDGFPIKFESSGIGWSYVLTSEYQGGNLTKQTTIYQETGNNSTSYSNVFKYDKKKSPFHYCQTPKWYMFYLFHMSGSKNNYTLQYWSEGEIEYKYEYDNAGFPIKRTSKNSDGKEFVDEFKYK